MLVDCSAVLEILPERYGRLSFLERESPFLKKAWSGEVCSRYLQVGVFPPIFILAILWRTSHLKKP